MLNLNISIWCQFHESIEEKYRIKIKEQTPLYIAIEKEIIDNKILVGKFDVKKMNLMSFFLPIEKLMN